MFGLFKKAKTSVHDAQDFLSAFLAEDALRSADMFLEHPAASFADDVPPNARVSVGLEFLIVGVHFLEREIHRAGLKQHFDSFIQPIRQLALIRFAHAAAPAQTNVEPYMDVWDSALHAYNPQQDFYRKPMAPGSKQSVSGQFGMRVAAVFGEGEYSFTAGTAALALGAQLAVHADSKVIEKTLKTIDWP